MDAEAELRHVTTMFAPVIRAHIALCDSTAHLGGSSMLTPGACEALVRSCLASCTSKATRLYTEAVVLRTRSVPPRAEEDTRPSPPLPRNQCCDGCLSRGNSLPDLVTVAFFCKPWSSLLPMRAPCRVSALCHLLLMRLAAGGNAGLADSLARVVLAYMEGARSEALGAGGASLLIAAGYTSHGEPHRLIVKGALADLLATAGEPRFARANQVCSLWQTSGPRFPSGQL